MSSINTNNFRQLLADSFVNAFTSNNIYIFLSRSQIWNKDENLGNPAVSELTAPLPTDNYEEYNRIHDNMIAIKKIDVSSVTKVVRKIVWAPGITYDMYKDNYSVNNPSSSGATNLISSNFYVVNSQFQVFKCIYNGESPENLLGIPTSVGSEPIITGSPTAIITTADGYRWKFLYSLTTNQVLKFANNNYIPVFTDAIVSAASVSGSINQTNIVDRGLNLNPGVYYTKVVGNGSGAVVSFVVPNDNLDPFDQRIASVSVLSAGVGYTYGKINLNNVFSDSACTNSVSLSSTALTNPETMLVPIISPVDGHGYNPSNELGANSVVVAPIIESIDGDIPINIQYRQYGVLKNPQIFNTTTPFTDTTGNCMHKIKFESSFTGTFVLGDTITQAGGGAEGVVIGWDGVNKVLSYYQNKYNNNGSYTPFEINNNTITATSGAFASPDTTYNSTITNSTFVNGFAVPEVKKYSGEIMYIENRQAINRSLDQNEEIKLILEF
jgi:hypothetical protein